MLVLGALLPLPAAAQEAAPSEEVAVHPYFDIISLYKPSAGFGLGGGVEVTNLVRPGSRLKLDAYIAQHAGEYEVGFFPRDLFKEGVSGGASARYETNGRLAYYGIGPRTTKNNRLFVETDEVALAGHVGLRRGTTGVVATAGYRTGTLSSFEDDVENAFSRLDATSAARIVRDEGQRVSGVSAGATAYLDRRDETEMPRRGVLLTAGGEGFADTEGTGFSFLRFHTSAAAHVPAGNLTFVLRALALHTVPLDRDLPLVLLPRLGHNVAVGPGSARFTGNDLLLLDVQVQHPVANLHPRYATDGFLILSAYNVYDNLFTDARLQPSWAEKFDDAARYPLRASFGAGLRAYTRESRKVVFTAAAGFSADGLAFSTLSFSFDPRRLRTPWRW